MKKGICLLLFFLSVWIYHESRAHGQQRIDSLLKVLREAREDSGKVNILNTLGKEMHTASDYDLARKYCSEALLLSEKIDFSQGKIRAYINTGIAYFHQTDYPLALKNYLAALAISIGLKDQQNIANCYNNIALVYTYQGDYPRALQYHNAALKTFERLGDKKGIANSYSNTGIIYYEQGKYPEALKSYLSALKVSAKTGDKKSIANCHLSICEIYMKLENYSEGLKMLSVALKNYEEAGVKHGVAICYANMVQCYANQKNYKKALETSDIAIPMLEQIGDKIAAAQARDIKGHIFLELVKYGDALKIFLQNLKVYQEIGDSSHTASAYNNVGEALLNQKEYGDAIKYFQRGLSLAKQIGSKERLIQSYNHLAESHEGISDYKKAFLFHKLYTSLRDSLFNETKSNQIAEMTARYDTERKDHDITLLNKNREIQGMEIKKQKLLKFSFIGGLGLVIIVLLFGYRSYQTRQTLRLQSIRNKIAGDLHDDIGSTLNSISIYSEVARRKDEQQDEALEMIGDASRKIIDAMSDIVWTINPDNDSFGKIIFRMKSFAYNLFRAKKIEYSFQADEALDAKKLSLEERRNLYLIFKEAVNNLVKYSGATNAAITLTQEHDHIRLRIRDNGIGFDPSRENTGNGLKNMKRRADEMKATLCVASGNGNGTQIELILKA